MSTDKITTFLMLALLLVVNLHTAGCVKNWKMKTKQDVCDKGFGFKGVCLNGQDKLNADVIPDALKSAWETFLQPIIRKAPFAPSLCFGDFSQTTLTELKGTQLANCHKFPLDANYQGYGTVGISVDKIPCGKPVPVNLCVIFDRCGTLGVSFNGGAVACVAAATTGIGAVVSVVAEAVKYVQFGFSYHKKFVVPVSVIAPTGGSPREVTVNARGHVYLGLGLEFPRKWLKVGKVDLSKYIDIYGEAAILVNFGRVGETVTRLINNIKNIGREGARGLVDTLLNSGAELAVSLKGIFTLKLDAMTKGFFPNIDFNIDTNFVATTGNSDTGLQAGIYVKVRTNILTKLLGALQSVIDRFSSVLETFGIPVPNITREADIILGLYITQEEIGFSFRAIGQNIQCAIKLSNFDASCEFGGKFFTALAKAAQWIFQTAKKLFDAAGKVVMAVAQEVGKFALNAAKAAYQFAKDTFDTVKKGAKIAIEAAKAVFNKAKEAAVRAFNAAKDFAVKTFNTVVKGLRELAEKAKQAAQKAINAVANTAKKVGNAVANTAKKVGNAVKRFFGFSLLDKSYEGMGLSKKALAQIKKIQMELQKTLAKLKQSERDAERKKNDEIKRAEDKQRNEVNQAEKEFKKREFEQNVKVAEAEERVKRINARIQRLQAGKK